jgi:exopolysaccharide production protein ExoZ
MALVFGMVSLEADGSIGRVPLLSYLGDASYSIYLWHTLAISVIIKAMAMLDLSLTISIIVAVIGGTVLGIGAYEFIEKPLKKMLSHGGLTRRGLERRPS